MKIKYLTFISVLSLLIGACGQEGPLYLPDEDQANSGSTLKTTDKFDTNNSTEKSGSSVVDNK
ncbi:MAG: hypothetical protein Kow0076_7700 [Francisella sp.]